MADDTKKLILAPKNLTVLIIEPPIVFEVLMFFSDKTSLFKSLMNDIRTRMFA